MTASSSIPKPPARLILTTPEHLLAFGFGAGLAPKAPGTAGTVVGIPFFLLMMQLPLPLYAAATAALFVLGCWVCGESARLLGVHDYGGIVFDEIVGFLIAAAPLLIGFPAPLWLGLLLAFGLFRLFDVWKPWPIRVLDARVHGGLGIMLDDVLAGVFSAAALYAIGQGIMGSWTT